MQRQCARPSGALLSPLHCRAASRGAHPCAAGNPTLRVHSLPDSQDASIQPVKTADLLRKGSDYRLKFKRNCKVRFIKNAPTHTL
ncbi:hypothetical protein Bxe_B1695 [Paraburkholderia xenovorans LB400]|uniref:Uncharacterized protein n=1 Tax=Paraburkholderia xenovorans (strain LB400) TaxID=266265 RepID=Q13NR8_PARXL|nr:hypothetical protein Bxe_B1695 [Paraburkholderia xenovorans LB400]